jgi:glycosyltransferase involved in cell wall biosynthesis
MVAISIALRHKVKIVHVRSYVPAVMALAACRSANAKLLFDIRGFWVDERVDGGLWPEDGSLYRSAKHVEKILFQSADHIVTLTHASARKIRSFPYFAGRAPPISVIPTCANLNRFNIGIRKSNETFVLGYLGSIGSWYLFDEIINCFKMLRNIQPRARMLIVNTSEHSLIHSSVARADIDPSLIDIQAADHTDVPPLVRRMSVGAALIKPAYSKLASAPTKLAEYLGCGVPCLGNAGVGDMVEILEGERVGVALNDFSEREVADGMKRLVLLAGDPETSRRCRETAIRLFSLETGATKYRQIYQQLSLSRAM